jgi:uncharacterized protein (TIGR00730 family)
MDIKSIAVFCGSSQGSNPIFHEQAIIFANELVKNNITMVYGGGNIGLMGVIADEMIKNGGKVIGVITDFLLEKEIAHQNLNELRIVKSMSERKNLMNDLSDAFIALPGGFGTFDEILEVLTYFQLNINSKPVGFFNIANYFDNLLKMFDVAVENRFMKVQHRNNIVVDDNAAILIQKMYNFKAEFIESKWIDNLKKTKIY